MGEPLSIPLTSRAGSANVRSIELLGRAGISWARPLVGQHLAAGRKLAPALELLGGRRQDPLAQRLGQATVGGDERSEGTHQGVSGVQPRAPNRAGVQIARASARVTWKYTRPRVATLKAGRPRRIIPLSKITAASAPR